MSGAESVTVGRVERAILVLRGYRVLIDRDLAALYGVQVKTLNQAVKRNLERFPEDFMFQVTPEEARFLRSQSVTLRTEDAAIIDVSSSPRLGWGRHAKYRPHAFTEQGVAMLSTVLRSAPAIAVNIEIMRAFVRLRQMLQGNSELARKLAELEQKYDGQFRIVFEAIRELMEPDEIPRALIGFRP
jgi:hypothetical protein